MKYGGNAMTDPGLAESFAADIVLLHSVGIRVVVVHGGGPQIGELMERLGKVLGVPRRAAGHRRRHPRHRPHGARRQGQPRHRRRPSTSTARWPSGLSGEDAGLIEAGLRDPDLGFVGDVKSVNPAIVESLLAQNLIPVVSTIGADLAGQAYNINADTVAGAIAGALGAEKVIYLTDVAGLLRDVADPHSLIATTHIGEIAELIASGVLSGGHDPEDRGLPRRRSTPACGRRTCSTAGCPTSCCSSCSPTPASAP